MGASVGRLCPMPQLLGRRSVLIRSSLRQLGGSQELSCCHVAEPLELAAAHLNLGIQREVLIRTHDDPFPFCSTRPSRRHTCDQASAGHSVSGTSGEGKLA